MTDGEDGSPLGVGSPADDTVAGPSSEGDGAGSSPQSAAAVDPELFRSDAFMLNCFKCVGDAVAGRPPARAARAIDACAG
jgi:hypothetical protein